VRRENGKNWRQVESGHFRVLSDCPLRYHIWITGILEQFYREVHPRFFSKPLPKLRIFLLETTSAYNSFLSLRGLGQIGKTLGLYIPSERAVFARRRLENGMSAGLDTLFHEVIHAMVDIQMRPAQPPVWFNEGFASLFEQGRVLKGRWVYGNPIPWRDQAFHQEQRAGRVPGLRRLIGMSSERFYESDSSRVINTAYNSGRSLLLYLLQDKGEAVLQSAVRGVFSGAHGVRALESASGMKIGEIEKEWKLHLAASSGAGSYVAGLPQSPSVDVLQKGVADFPGYGLLRLYLAEAYYRDKKTEAALAEAEAALVDPRFFMPERAFKLIAIASLNSDPGRAMQALKKIVELQPWLEDVDEWSHKQLAQLLKSSGDSKGAAEVLAQLAVLQDADLAP
jgi:tetratricopeptide (TPR) repeat protein